MNKALNTRARMVLSASGCVLTKEFEYHEWALYTFYNKEVTLDEDARYVRWY